MKIKLFIFTLLSLNILFSQDTLKLTNGNEFGYNEQYILYPNGTFKYSTEGYCTGTKILGVGSYVRSKKRIEFNFEQMDSLIPITVCVKFDYTDSVKILTYNMFDSTMVSGLVGYSNKMARTSTNNMYSRSGSTFGFLIAGMNVVNVSIDSTCSEYHVYLVPKFLEREAGLTDVILFKRKKWFKTTTYISENDNGKAIKKKYTSWYDLK